MDAERIILCIVSFLFPIVGIILWAVKKDEGKIYGIVGIASWIISAVVGFISGFLIFVLPLLLESLAI